MSSPSSSISGGGGGFVFSLEHEHHQRQRQNGQNQNQQLLQQLLPPSPALAPPTPIFPPPAASAAPANEQLCYVHCNLCDTILAVSVPCSSLFMTVTVRCGHCTNLIPVNMRALLLPTTATATTTTTTTTTTPPIMMDNSIHEQLLRSLSHNIFSRPTSHIYNHLLDEIPNFGQNLNLPPAMNTMAAAAASCFGSGRGPNAIGPHQLPTRTNPVSCSRPPEKRQRVPSAYNRFIKEEIQRIKTENPDISHREAFSAAAKNWAHFPHIHFGLMPNQMVKKTTSVHPQERMF